VSNNFDCEDAAGAIDAAQQAFEKWSTVTAYQRSDYLYKKKGEHAGYYQHVLPLSI
jgi:acyl-CoA reductase-like NAD-dependent aldehyde dehydrogenase